MRGRNTRTRLRVSTSMLRETSILCISAFSARNRVWILTKPLPKALKSFPLLLWTSPFKYAISARKYGDFIGDIRGCQNDAFLMDVPAPAMTYDLRFDTSFVKQGIDIYPSIAVMTQAYTIQQIHEKIKRNTRRARVPDLERLHSGEPFSRSTPDSR